MKWIAIFLIALMMVPVASATTQSIIVQDDSQRAASFSASSDTVTYQFSPNPNYFNLTNSTDNLSVWQARIEATLIEPGDIKEKTSYVIMFNWNDTESAGVRYTFTPSWYGYWTSTYDWSHYRNGERIDYCQSSERGLHGWTKGAPNPKLTFNYDLSGRYGTNPSLQMSWYTNAYGERGRERGLLSDFFSIPQCDSKESIGGGIQIIMNELTAMPSVTITSDQGSLYTHVLDWKFGTKQERIEVRDAFIADANSESCKQIFIFAGVCDVFRFMDNAIGLLFTGIVAVQKQFVGQIPFIGPLLEVALEPIVFIVDAANTLTQLFFVGSTLGEYDASDVFHMLLAWVTTMGTIFAIFTGNMMLVLLWPYYFTKYVFLGIGYVFFFTFIWLPKEIAKIVATLIPG